MMAEIIQIEPTDPFKTAPKRVAAYARVSLASERLHHSMQAQVSYYRELILNHPGWELAGIYADEGISGTLTRKRTDFQRMIRDCVAGQIDLILTKSISRFARNTVDLLETVRHLKAIGVEVIFEEQHISSMTESGEFMLTILASFAQEEVRNISSNIKWSVRKAFAEGRPHSRFPILGYRWEGYDLIPVPKEADVVRGIFALYLSGLSMRDIIAEARARGYRTGKGLPYNRGRIYSLLRREIYTGKLLLQQTYVADPISKQRKTNHGELMQYRILDHHKAIISEETFESARDMRKKRAHQFYFIHNHKPSVFTKMIRCSCCGAYYWRTTNTNSIGRTKYVYWLCSSKKSRKKTSFHCPSKGLPDDRLKAALAPVLGIETFDDNVFLRKVDHLEMGTSILQIFFRDGSQSSLNWEFNGKEAHHRLRIGRRTV